MKTCSFKARLCALVLAAAMLLSACGGTTAQTSSSSETSTAAETAESAAPRAITEYGTYIGAEDADTGVAVYKGITYGQAERWQRAVLPEKTDAEISALEYGPAPMQDPENTWGCLLDGGMDADCLNLNLFVKNDGETKKPVMVWIYGGAQQVGSNIGYEGEEYDGCAMIAENPDIILVVPNYRTGFWGSVNLSVLDGYSEEYSASNNLARTDILLSLQWVRENIEAFGGDPDNVTLFGQSAGSNNISCLLLMEEAHQYFRKAICESSFACDISLGSLEDSAIVSKAYFDSLGVTTVEEALAKTDEELLAAQKEITANSVSGASAFAEIESKLFTPIADGVVIPTDYWETLMAGGMGDIKLMTGTNAGEYDNQYGDWENDPQAALDFTISQNWGKLSDHGWNKDNAQAVIDEFYSHNEEYNRSDFVAAMDLKNDLYLRVGALAYASVFSQFKDTYVYYFEYEKDTDDLERAYHGIEIPIVFNHDYLGTPETLQKGIRQAWLNFARTGDPNNEYLGTTWKPYNNTTHDTLIISETPEMVEGVRQDDVDLLMPLLREAREYPDFLKLLG